MLEYRNGFEQEELRMKLRTKLVIVFLAVMFLTAFFTTVAMHTFAFEKASEIQQLYLLVVIITTGLLIYWIYRTISVPLAKLQKAARNIKEGNLGISRRATWTSRSRARPMTRSVSSARILRRCG